MRAEQIMLMRSYRSTAWQIFRIVQLPNALPYIFAGLNVGIVLSVIGTIVGEFVGTTTGLGHACCSIITTPSILPASSPLWWCCR